MMNLYRMILKYFLAVAPVLCGCLEARAQSVSPQVINAAGGGGPVGTSGIEVYYNIGEAFYTTLSSNSQAITQGFLQPEIVGEFGLTAGAFMTPASCADKTDGSIRVEAKLPAGVNPANFRISYYWSNTALCLAGNTCSTVTNLAAGTYSVMVVCEYTASGSAVPTDTVKLSDLVVSGSSEPCQVTVYNGFSPNGDGVNEVFYIENITQFPGNKVEVYNRWGQKLADIKDYDNADNAWRGTVGNSSQQAPAATYFYIIDLGNGTAPLKGWLELTNNR
jgi:gliding motility-associated-like protein